MKRKKSLYVVIFIVVAALFLFILTKVRAETPIYEISNFNELVEAASLSRQSGNQNYTFILTDDIEITQADQANLESSDFKYISFGSEDYPFAGTFDGQGHYIANLKYDSDILVPNADTGLFSYTTTGAVIKNLTILNADIESDYRGGIVVGHAEGTTLENITVKNSHLFVSAINNVLTLITDGGIRGGAIAGEAENCVLYNCESEGTRVNTNNTSGVAALAGKGLYLGGLVGTAYNTEVEYSRVIGGLVKNYYDVVVGAVGGNTLYVGGLIGQMKNGSKVIDSFSTAELNFYAATYVAVGAGNTGHIGGITGAMYGERNEVIRCHYAGEATSRQYNAVLVVPIIQDNVNISGITNVFEGGSVVNTYFKPSLNPDVEMNVLENSNSTSSYGPLSDERYIDKDYWQTQNYDFYGNVRRQSLYNSNHTNKWIMDYENDMPVHGISIAAGLDFTNAGTVTIGSTDLVNTTVSTSQAPIFAVQGLKMNEDTASITATENTGYRFVAWYKVPNVTFDTVDDEHIYYDDIFSRYSVYSNNRILTNIEINDNDLFVAYYQAKVTFHDINGGIVDTNTGNTVLATGESDWYDYLDELPEVEPNTRPSSTTARLIGWTTTASNEVGGGYSSITVPQLTALRNNNTLYEAGDKITETLELYPVYMDLISNISTVFEGNEQDSTNDVTRRDGVGYTTVSMNQNDEIVINVIGLDQNDEFPDGYRFLGWYDEDGMRVSKEQEYVLQGVDVSVEHTYTARFEYRVDYYVRAYGQNNGNSFTTSELFATRWEEYNTQFESIPGPGYIRENITHWGTSHVNHGNTDNTSDAYSGYIVAPLTVYSHNWINTTGNGTAYQLSMTTDFPGSGEIVDQRATTGAEFLFTPVSNRYHLMFWTLEREGLAKTYAYNPMETGTILSTRTYQGMAMVTTDINFYHKDNTFDTVTRRYEDNLFMNSNSTYTYYYPFFQTTTVVSTTTDEGQTISSTVVRQASPSDNSMQINGYVFLGWISTAEVEKNGDEWDYIYDVANDAYCTSDISKAKPYLLDANALVYETFDVYPVYAKWNITTTTNAKGFGGLYNVPPNPTYTLQESALERGKGVVTIVPDENTYIQGNSGEKYELLELVRVYPDGTEEVIELNNNAYTYNVEAGQEYVFMAKYRPYTVVYHLNTGTTNIQIRNYLDPLGEMPTPSYSLGNNGYVFVGWTDEEPANSNYYSFETYQAYQTADLTEYTENSIVYKALELYPIYVRVQAQVQSNIDATLTQNSVNLSSIRYITRPSVNQIQLNAKTSEQTNDLDGYVFEGWYVNYQNDANRGDLLTRNTTYILEGNEGAQATTYTAVYTRIYGIYYHDTTGAVIYTAYVDENTSRTFVTQTLDNNNNTVEVPIDSGAYDAIWDSLEANEIFLNWQWEQANGTLVQWEDFYDQTVTGTMDLYPIIRRIEVTDPSGDDVDIIVGMENDEINLCFDTEYEEPYISIHVEDVAYDSNGVSSSEDIEDMPINLYASHQSMQSTLGEATTDEDGEAIIYLFGKINITQLSEQQDSDDDVFIYQILDANNHVIDEVSVPLGETKTIIVPYGRYRVRRKANWAWRYPQSITNEFGITNLNIEENVNFVKNKVTNKWFDGTSYIDNDYE